MTRKTHTVTTAYTGRDGKSRVYVKDHPLPLICDEPLKEGAAVVIVSGRAIQHQNKGAA